jgi:hypothetical protein
MRTMNLPPFPGEEVRIEELSEYLKARLSLDTVPWPDHAWRLLAHMAWPNDASRRDLWMAAQIGTQLEPESASEEEGALAGVDVTPPYLPAQSPSLEYFRLFGAHAPLAKFANSALHQEIRGIQVRWGRVADILHHHYDMTAGHHMKRRGGASVGKAIELIAVNSRVKGRSAASSWAFWSEFKDVAHLVAAAVLISYDAKTRCKREEWTLLTAQLQPYRVVMLAPDAVLAVGKWFQEYGLGLDVHGRDEPLFDPQTLWRIPDWINVERLPPPTRRLTKSDIRILGARRAKSPTRVRKRTPPQHKATPV